MRSASLPARGGGVRRVARCSSIRPFRSGRCWRRSARTARPCSTGLRRSSPTCSGAASASARPCAPASSRGPRARRASSRRWTPRDSTILNVFGMTEIGAASACRASDPASLRTTTAGRALPGYEFRIAPGEHRQGEPGELQVRGPVRDRRLLPPAGADGGGVRRRLVPHRRPRNDRRGGLHQIAGRSKEVVHVGGVQRVPGGGGGLPAHPPGRGAGRGGRRSPRADGRGARGVRGASPGPEIEPAALLRFARSQIAGYKLPYAIRVLPELAAPAIRKAGSRGALESGARSGSAA